MTLKAVNKETTNKKPKKQTRRSLIEDKLNWYKQREKTLTPEEVAEMNDLEAQLVKSKRGKSSKVKGASYERTIAKKFKDKFNLDLVRTPQSGGFAKKSTKADDFRGDITTVDKDLELMLHIECKDHKTWSVTKWIEQSESDCPEGKISTVIAHRGQKVTEGKVSQKSGDYVILSLDDFLNLVTKEDIVRKKVK